MSVNNSKTLELFSQEQFSRHGSADDCWVTLSQRKIYDVSKFLKDHPEGSDVLLKYAGKDVTEIVKERKDVEDLEKILVDKYLVGYLATSEEEKKLLSNPNHKVEVKLTDDDKIFDSTTFVASLPAEDKLSIATDYSTDYKKHHFLDLNKPLLPQVMFGNYTRDFYVDQIHRPRHYGKGSAPLFGNFLEPLSKTSWYVIPMVWLPVVIYNFSVALKNMNFFLCVFFFCLGVFVWTLIEYCLHRFLFHLDDVLPEHNIFYTLHFLLHGVHHYLPMDKYRLVMPPTLFIVLCTPFYKLVFALLPLYVAYAGFAGGLFGYVCYDLTHYFLHHSKLPPFARKLKKYHLEHHYKNYQLGFGVTSWFWDNVFGTYLAPNSPVSQMKYE